MTFVLRPSPHLNPNELVPSARDLAWPDGRGLAACLTFEMWSSESSPALQIINSTVDFGVKRGIHHVLDVLGRHGAKATFFVNGRTATRYVDTVREIAALGHDVAPLGYELLPHWNMTPDVEREQIRAGMDAVGDAIGAAPRGWRTPYSRLSLDTLTLLHETDLSWDSSLRNDEMVSKFSAGDSQLIEIPFGGSVDYSYYSPFPGPVRLVKSVMSTYRDEIEVLAEESRRQARLSVLNFNPSFAGRPADLAMLDSILASLEAVDTGTWFATCSEVADWMYAHDDWFVTPDEAREAM